MTMEIVANLFTCLPLAQGVLVSQSVEFVRLCMGSQTLPMRKPRRINSPN